MCDGYTTVLMGATVSRTSSTSTKASVGDVLNEKEFIFLVLQSEIHKAIEKQKFKELRRIEKEIIDHIHELKDLIRYKKWKTEIVDRTQKLIHNYELSLAKVRSIYNTVSRNRHPKRSDRDLEDQTYANYSNSPRGIPKDTVNRENDMYISKDDMPSTEVDTDLVHSLEVYNDSDYTDEPTYANVEYLEFESTKNQPSMSEFLEGVKNKPPMPKPRSRHDGLMKEIPNYYIRLYEILEKEVIDSSDVEEVLEIRKKTNEIKNIFKAKMEEILNRYETAKKNESAESLKN